jgi:hypothetical protein
VVKADSQNIKLHLEHGLLSGKMSRDPRHLVSEKRRVALVHSLTGYAVAFDTFGNNPLACSQMYFACFSLAHE